MKKIDFGKYPLPRIRHHANPVLYFPLKQHKGRNFIYPEIYESIDWNKIFKNGFPPNCLDIGCGLGKFMIEYAVENPNINILGFEIRKAAVEWIENVINSENIPNAKALWYSAVNGFGFIESNSIEKIFLFFPDPWFKKRHYKRRMFNENLIDEIHRVLKSHGKLYMMTDVPEVDEHQTNLIKRYKNKCFNLLSNDFDDLIIKSNHEEFCIKKNIPIIKKLYEKL